MQRRKHNGNTEEKSFEKPPEHAAFFDRLQARGRLFADLLPGVRRTDPRAPDLQQMPDQGRSGPQGLRQESLS